MHPSFAFTFARIAREFEQWRAVPEGKRSDAPGWWWGPSLALRHEPATLPDDQAAMLGLAKGAPYGAAAGAILEAISTQKMQPWPDDFPEKYSPKAEDPAAQAESAAQAASAAIEPL